MRCRPLAFAIAGAFLWLSVPAQAAGAPDADRARFEGELEALDGRIQEAEGLLQRIDRGGVYLVTNGMVVSVVTREQLVEWATDQLYREGAGIGGGQDRAFVLRRVQGAVAGSPRLIASLREALREDRVQRQVVQARLAQLRAAADSAAVSLACSLPHSWRIDIAGRGSANVTADAAGTVSGAQITTGRATLAGNRLTIQWFARGGQYEVGGRYIVTLDRGCNGTGELVLDVVPTGASELGIRGGPVTFTSIGAGPP
jgi:hypothetical protein